MIYLTIIPQGRVGYEMIVIISYPTSASGIIVLLKNNQESLLDLVDFALQEQYLEDNLMVSISWAWYNGS